MKKTRIAIRTQEQAEGALCLAPVVAALKKTYPGAEIGIVGEESLREASFLLPELDFFATEIDPGHADMVFGFHGKDSPAEEAGSSEWRAYAAAAESLRQGNPFHRIDILRKIANADTVDTNFELLPPQPQEELPSALTSPDGMRVGICAGSLGSAEIEATLLALSRLTIPLEIFVVGTVKDKRAAGPALTAWDGKLAIHDLCGRLSLSGVAAVLRACDMNLVGPGMSAILSSGYGTFTVCVDQEPHRGPLAYPYGHGHLVIQPSAGHELCKEAPALIRDVIEFAVSANNGTVPSLDQWQRFADAAIDPYLGRLRLLATQRVEIPLSESGDNAGAASFTELYLRPLLFLGSETHDVMLTFYRLLWEHSLNGRSITTFDLQVLHQETVPALCALLKPMEQLYELAYFGRTYSAYVKDSLETGNLARAKQESQRLQEVEELIHNLTAAQPVLAPLSLYHHHRQQLLAGDNPIHLAGDMVELFTELQGQVLSLLDLAQTLFHTTFQAESALAGPSLEEELSDG